MSRPDFARDFIFVDDLVDLYMEAMEKAAAHKGEIFNAASGIRTPLKTLVNCVLKISGSNSRINWNAFRDVIYDSDTWQADMDKTFGAFIWRPKYELEDGLRKSIQWFRINDSYATS